MHSMAKSATLDVRERRRVETIRRIHACAQALALDHGLDGFSMDDLADAAEVSRRTLFNYVAGKDAAVLGPDVAFVPAVADAFASGGPTGRLVDDLAALVISMLENHDLRAEEIARGKLLLAREPRLMALAHQRFECRAAEVLSLIEHREGAAFDPERGRVVIHVLAALFDVALAAYVERPDRALGEIFLEAVDAARSAFA